jgi:hypothetical protein
MKDTVQFFNPQRPSVVSFRSCSETHARARARARVCVCVCVRVCARVYIYIYIYTRLFLSFPFLVKKYVICIAVIKLWKVTYWMFGTQSELSAFAFRF